METIQIFWRFVLKFNRILLSYFTPNKSYKNFQIPKLIKNNNKNKSIEYKLLNQTIKLDNINWQNNYDKLTNYHLHYFDFLNNCNSKIGEQAINKWIIDNPPSLNNDGWEPYPISLRIVNWFFFFSKENIKPTKQIINSLYLQVQWLFKQREFHLLANHLLKNIVALLFYGYCFNNKKITQWSLKNLQKQLSEQFGESGMHYEYSPTYHANAIMDILNCFNLIQSENIKIENKLKNKIENVLGKGVGWINKISDNNFYLPIGDVNYEGCPTPIHIQKYSQKLGINKIESVDKIFPILKSDNFKIMLINSPFSPSYNCAHSHQDKLSVLLWYKDKPILTDTGNYSYNFCDERKYSRSIEAHNSIKIDEYEQAEMWDVFRVGYRGKIEFGEIGTDKIVSIFIHKKYRHERKIQNVGKIFFITDIIYAKGNHSFKQYFHIHPTNSIKKLDNELIINNTVNIKFQNDFKIVKTDYYSEMYKKEKKDTAIVYGDFINKVKIVTEISDNS